MQRFDRRIVLVTGAAGGIGRAICARVAAEGATTIACDRETASSSVDLALDVTQEEAWNALAVDIASRFGRLDVLVNCAGVLSTGTVEETTSAAWQTMLEVNLTGAFLGCRALLPLLRKGHGANIVNVASIVGLRGNLAMVGYSASKGGVVAMTCAMALDNAAFGLRVNAVCPGSIETPMVERFLAASPDPVAARAVSAGKQPMGRLGSAAEVAAAVAFLASDDAAFVTGVALPVDGGRSIR